MDSNKLIEEMQKLNQYEREKVLNAFRGGSSNLPTNFQNKNYTINDMIREDEEKYQNRIDEEPKRIYKQLDMNALRQSLDYKDVWDFYYSAVATIENIALGRSKNKEYGNWDEFDSSSRKNRVQLVIQFLKILKAFKGAFYDYLKDYDDIIDYPENMQITCQKINNWLIMINDEKIEKYAKELMNIVNLREAKMDIQAELEKYYKKEKYKEDEMRNGVEAIMKCSNKVKEDEKKYKKIFEEKGEFPKYEVKLNIPAGKAFKNT